MNLDRFPYPMPWENFAPPEYPHIGDTGLYCTTCGGKLYYIEYEDTEVDYNGAMYGTGGGTELMCERCG